MHFIPSKGMPRPLVRHKFLQSMVGLVLLVGGQMSGLCAEYALQKGEDRITVLRDGKMMTALLSHSGHKPVLYPVVGPDEVPVTRAYPIEDAKATEKKDHIHHRSFWFTHGEVNGIDFWAEGEGKGNIIQRVAETNRGGESAVIETENDWVGPDGTVILTDVRRFEFHDVLGDRVIDFNVTLRAGDSDVVFGDTKEGSFGIRVAGSMKVDAMMGGKITNSNGENDGKAWGQPAKWVDYVGPVMQSPDDPREPVVGIAVLNHPDSFGYPTRWHVRTYGLFAANPFGVHHFTGGNPTEGVRLKPGEKLGLKYRVILHAGGTDVERMESHWKAYAGN